MRQKLVRFHVQLEDSLREDMTSLIQPDLNQGWTVKTITTLYTGSLSARGDLLVVFEKPS